MIHRSVVTTLKLPAAFAIAACLVACSTPSELPRGMQTYSDAKEAYVDIHPATGSAVTGRLRVDPFGNGIRITGQLDGFPQQGEYAFHINEHATCHDDAAAPGGIFNPYGSRHGRYARGEHMLGDMDNLEVDASLSVHVSRNIQGVTLGGGHYDDVSNRSFVIHERPDDYTSQPDGNAGRPIACGVVQIINPPPPAG